MAYLPLFIFSLSHTFIARRVWLPILLLFEYLTIVRHCCKHFAVRLWTNTIEVCKLCNVFHKSYYSTAIETTLIPFVLTRVQYITHWRTCCLARNSPFENDRRHPPMLTFILQDTLPCLTTSLCIYHFTCSCGVWYMGFTTRQLYKRIREHHLMGLTRGTISTIKSSILKHLVDSNHGINVEKAFTIVYTTPANQPLTTRIKHLNMTEAILINFHKPELCSLKKLLHKVLLSGPSLSR